MYIDRVPNRNSPPAVLLRESYRDGAKVKKRTVANLSKLPDDVIEQLRILLRGGRAVESLEHALEVIRSLPHGHVVAVLGTLYHIGLDRIIFPAGSRELALVLAMIVARVIDPRSKLAIARGLDPETAATSLGEVLELGFSDDSNRFDGRQPSPHPHLICVRCRRIVDPDVGVLDRWADDLESRTGYRILCHRLDFYGVCPGCQQEE